MAKLKTTDGAPNIATTQAMYYRVGRFGKMYNLRRTRPKRASKPRTAWWEKYTLKSQAWLNRQLTRGISRYWKTKLSQATRDLWTTAAAAGNWQAYDGLTSTPNGFQLYMAAQRLYRYWGFSPFFNGANLFKPTEVVHGYSFEFPNAAIPSPFQPYDPPNVTSVEIFDGYDMFIHLDNDPDQYNCDLDTVIASHFNPTTERNPTQYIATYHSYNPIWAGEGTADIYFDYPNPAQFPSRAVRIGLRWVNFITNQIGAPTWILASS